MQKKRTRKKRRGLSAAGMLLIATGLVALASYLAGGVRVHHASADRQAEIRANIAVLREMEAKAPVDLDAATASRRRAARDARRGIMVDDLAAEQDRIISLEAGSRADLARWFENAAIVGDSIVEDIAHYGWLKAPVFAETGLRASAELPLLDKVVAARPSVVFLCFGINDIETYREKVDVFTSRYRSMVHLVRVSLPEAAVYVNAIFPCAERVLAGKSQYQYLDAYNAALQSICDELGAYYIDSGFIFRRRPELYNNDGIHATRAFYPYWLCYLADISGLSDEEHV